jgi:hypothetical protein
MNDEETIIVACYETKRKGDNDVNKIEDVSGFTTCGEHGTLMENSEHCSSLSSVMLHGAV